MITRDPDVVEKATKWPARYGRVLADDFNYPAISAFIDRVNELHHQAERCHCTPPEWFVEYKQALRLGRWR